ncbi:GNAT family N-acetyltransferase [Desertifilum sp. FACHB-1129]|uniref:GNAT family N-acetyltransferase n=2 Tax=Desertifilum tharense IPPAS B-1220 TaxID=1781255 RepID=A0A1E5QPD0_9CYAN|nr:MULTISPECIES: GNAT family N-acetyltransferase [Desertifilum]MDA0211018.1 GNAT family N-acetyltransferase [Cyanobacteria bacterium FC1]MBD2312728.1 GNAT family N-acetyltransferase [Desertifilum sp. FACHB-1129]MBD2320209.1 GNAT family N-acetyltransferase [Desertifilum sp. FACHB-866]MBD2330337.1 GNAT family N-acetyltransferase [Desertifilum sp. FACHB-868]OEJ76522.1 GNAT family N-acetyltransferase [Desertifilum tharense IPPAS B-1220]
MDLQFRLCTQNDLPILQVLLSELDSELQLSEGQMQAIFERICQIPNYHYYLAQLAGEPVGCFSLLIVPTFLRNGACEALLDSVVVLPPYRGQGIGRTMMQEVARICREAGCYKITLSSNLKRDRAHQFYQNLGFEQHGWSFSLDLCSIPLS